MLYRLRRNENKFDESEICEEKSVDAFQFYPYLCFLLLLKCNFRIFRRVVPESYLTERYASLSCFRKNIEWFGVLRKKKLSNSIYKIIKFISIFSRFSSSAEFVNE